MEFLDKLEDLLIQSNCVGYKSYDAENTHEKDFIVINTNPSYNTTLKKLYIQEYIKSLKDKKYHSLYSFSLDIFDKQLHFLSIFNLILTLKPTDKNLLDLCKEMSFQEEEILKILKEFKNKKSVISFLQRGNNYIKNKDSKNYNDAIFLDKCFKYLHYLNFIEKDYYLILSKYIDKSKNIFYKDKFFLVCQHYIKDEKLLETLIYKLFKENISLTSDKFVLEKKITKIEINRLSLIKKFTLISEYDLEILLLTFVELLCNHMILLEHTHCVHFLKTPNTNKLKNGNHYLFNLFIDSDNTKEIVELLALYLDYFNVLNKNTNDFVKHIKNSQDFKKFILYKKLNKKLTIKNNKNMLIKI